MAASEWRSRLYDRFSGVTGVGTWIRLERDRARDDIGYKPKIDFDQGIAQYYHWLKVHDSIYRS